MDSGVCVSFLCKAKMVKAATAIRAAFFVLINLIENIYSYMPLNPSEEINIATSSVTTFS